MSKVWTNWQSTARRIARIEESGKLIASLVPPDAILAASLLLVADGYWLKAGLSVADALGLGLVVALCHLPALCRVPPSPAPARIAARLVLANALAAAVVTWISARLEIGFARGAMVRFFLLATPVQFAVWTAHLRRRRFDRLETWRWLILIAASCVVAGPFLTDCLVGSADAHWYGNMAADFIAQWRAGVFPVFVGQSDFAFNGAIKPLRLAPFLQHATGALDLLTAHSLSSFGLVNLVIFLSLLGTALGTYGCLVAVRPERRWFACAAALCVLGSPATLSLAYTGSLFMSVTALPFVPLVLLGIWRSFEDGSPRSLGFLAAGLAAAWYCHPPIALWLTVLAALSQAVRLGREGSSRRLFTGWLTGGGVFLALTAGLFAGVFTAPSAPVGAKPELIMRSLQLAMPGAFLPVSEGVNALSDYQLGWSLWIMLILGGGFALRRRSGFGLALAAAALLFLVLVLPVPGVTRFLWTIAPASLREITFVWPMQRFYVVLAGIAVFLLGHALAPRISWRGRIATAVGMGAALGWTGLQAEAFVEGGGASRQSAVFSQVSQLPQNRNLTRYAYESLPVVPPYYSHGYVDPLWENRLLEPQTWREIASNARAAAGDAGTPVQAGVFSAKRNLQRPTFLELQPHLQLAPGHRYALELDLTHPELHGTLLISSPTLSFETNLPDPAFGMQLSGPSTAFGALPSSRRSVSLRVSTAPAEDVLLQFVANDPLPGDLPDFGRFVLREYDAAHLPVVVESWAPYRAHVTSAAATWLETPRIYLPGYRARVNGKSVAPRRSPSGLVMFPLEPGENAVVLDYPGPFPLRIACLLSLGAWAAVGLLALRPRGERKTAAGAV
jgi:hypothetical protein